MDFMKKNGCDPNTFNYSTLMNRFCKEGNLQEAKRVFNEMKDVGLNLDKVGYTTFINCLCIGGKVAIGILKEMEGKGCKGDTDVVNASDSLDVLINYVSSSSDVVVVSNADVVNASDVVAVSNGDQNASCLLFSFLITDGLTDATKYVTGRPRPDFFWRCFPDGVDRFTS
ncbi:tetratricopeptide-like helical domain-containing protein [Artemisia annua]|uniref:Tetratricopeptide-like helical domain-containing protein n=1 Tax=Artemisia annua TaxID=35608 RepID=A0A2U1NDE7_ARTAN|nr:tetratricopeptide-like helical domain-containing protein [Artemisia annua]